MSLEEKLGIKDNFIRKGKRVLSYFLIGSMLSSFGCGKKETITAPPNDPPSTNQLEIAVSNNNGIVDFGNGSITVLNEETQEPVGNITLSNFNGENYNVITSHDEDYFSFSGFFDEINNETLFVHEKEGENLYVWKELNYNEKGICFNFLDDLHNSRERGFYKGTMTGNEASIGYYITNLIMQGVGLGFVMQIVGNLASFFNEEGNDLQNHIFQNNWDKYEFPDPAGFGGKIYYTVTSNKPELNLEMIINENNVVLNFSTFDEFNYSGVDFLDGTITDRGPTSNNDLYIGYCIYENGIMEHSNSFSFSSNTESNFRTATLNLPDGPYNIEATLYDDTYYYGSFQGNGVNNHYINEDFDVNFTPVEEGEVLFVRADLNNFISYDIYKTNESGDYLSLLAENAVAPDYLSLNDKIIFRRVNQLYMMDSDGQNIENLEVNISGSPRWSSDGDKIVFRDFDYDIKMYDMNSENISTIVSNGQEPCFNSDRTKIVYVRKYGYRISTVDVSGNNIQHLTDSGPSDSYSDPRYGPDDKIVYCHDYDIWTMNHNGSNKYQITNTDSSLEYSPSWTDGGNILFVRMPSGSSDSGIYIINSNGYNESLIYDGVDYLETYPEWKGSN
jgi:hypothetical protein